MALNSIFRSLPRDQEATWVMDFCEGEETCTIVSDLARMTVLAVAESGLGDISFFDAIENILSTRGHLPGRVLVAHPALLGPVQACLGILGVNVALLGPNDSRRPAVEQLRLDGLTRFILGCQLGDLPAALRVRCIGLMTRVALARPWLSGDVVLMSPTLAVACQPQPVPHLRVTPRDDQRPEVMARALFPVAELAGLSGHWPALRTSPSQVLEPASLERLCLGAEMLLAAQALQFAEGRHLFALSNGDVEVLVATPRPELAEP